MWLMQPIVINALAGRDVFLIYESGRENRPLRRLVAKEQKRGEWLARAGATVTAERDTN